VYVVKVVIALIVLKEGQKKEGFCVHLILFKPTRVVPSERVGRDRRLEASETIHLKKQTECLDSFDWIMPIRTKMRGAR